MANIAWPDQAIPSEFSLTRYTKVLRNKSMFGHTGQNIDLLNDRWLASVSLATKSKEDAGVIESFVNNFRSGANTVQIYHFSRPEISGRLSTPTLYSNITLGSESINIAAQAGDSLKAGDMLGIAGLLLQVAFDCQAAGGVLTATLTHRVRKSVSSGTAVQIEKPTGKFRLIGKGSSSYGPGGIIIASTYEFAEVID